MKSLKNQISRYKKLILFLLIVLAVLAFVLFRNARSVNSTTNLVIEKVQTRNVEQKVTADGNIQGLDKRVVYFTPNQKVTEIRVSIGDQVNKDDVLAVLTTVDGRNINTEVRSPINGIVTESNYKQNDIVSAVSSEGFIVVDTSSYKIELQVNENDIANLKTGQTCKITYPAISIDDEYLGEVERVYPDSLADSAAVTYRVIVKPTEVPEGLKLGMSANVVITTAQAVNVIAIPESFIVEKDDKVYLKFLNWTDSEKTNYSIEEKEVQIGLRTDEYVELKSGAKDGDEVVEPEFKPQRLSIFGN